MLSFLTIIRRSLLVVVIALAADGAIAYLLTLVQYAFAETMGDLMLVEAAALFILAGLIDFSTSIGATQFRKTVLASKQDYSPFKHKEYERRALIFLIAGLILLGMLVFVAVYPLS
jgi:hypothetical protein